MAALNVLIETVLFWQLADLAQDDGHRVRPVVALFAIANIAHAALCLKFFFLTPVIPDLVLAALLCAAMLAPESRRTR